MLNKGENFSGGQPPVQRPCCSPDLKLSFLQVIFIFSCAVGNGVVMPLIDLKRYFCRFGSVVRLTSRFEAVVGNGWSEFSSSQQVELEPMTFGIIARRLKRSELNSCFHSLSWCVTRKDNKKGSVKYRLRRPKVPNFSVYKQFLLKFVAWCDNFIILLVKTHFYL